jgi:uncharacterized membrane protein YidH (DUF202 family)
MIERYGDHAANERTFLAWIRTAIAIVAFGFLVARFDLFLRIQGAIGASRIVPTSGGFVGDAGGSSGKGLARYRRSWVFQSHLNGDAMAKAIPGTIHDR